MTTTKRSATMFIQDTSDVSLTMLQATIPASQIVQVIPNVLGAGGNQLDTIGLCITSTQVTPDGAGNCRIPIGVVQQFALAANVSTFFGPTSHEASLAAVYFDGFSGASKFPAALLFAQFPATAVAAYLRGGNVSSLTLQQLQAVNGILSITVDGYIRSASVNLIGSTSFSAGAALIQSSLNAAITSVASVTGSVGPQAANFTAFIAGNVMTVSALASGTLAVGASLGTVGGVAPGTTISGQLTGATGSIGTYAVSIPQVVIIASGLTATYSVLNVTAVGSGTVSVGQTLSGAGITAGTKITELLTGGGLTGTYVVTNSQTASSTTITATPTPINVLFDSVSGGFIFTSGIQGSASTIGFAVAGTVANSLLLTSSTGAINSQGSPPLTAGAFMNSITALNANWATFFLAFDPDNAAPSAQTSANGFTNKYAFSLWTGQEPYLDYMFISWDTDPNPTNFAPATGSYGYALQQAFLDGTFLIWQPTDLLFEAFVSGAAASINFEQLNGRITFAFKGQSGLSATVTNATNALNLISNGYNFYGAYATANQQFVFLYPGSVSGRFKWGDSYVNQIWLNNNFQLDLIELLTTVYSIPYNPYGFSLIEASLQDTINQGLNFGAYRSGVVLSSTQTAAVNGSAGLNIATTLNQRGWYLQVLDPGPVVREARGSPLCTFWYTDGEAVQAITLNSIDLL